MGVVAAGAPVLELHEVEGVRGGRDEEELHGGVVDGDERVGDEVDIAGEEDDEVEELRLEGDAAAGPGCLDFVEEDEDGGEVGEVAEEAEYVHGGGVESAGGRRGPLISSATCSAAGFADNAGCGTPPPAALSSPPPAALSSPPPVSAPAAIM